MDLLRAAAIIGATLGLLVVGGLAWSLARGQLLAVATSPTVEVALSEPVPSAAGPPPSAPTSVGHTDQPAQATTLAYWTRERLASAQPAMPQLSAVPVSTTPTDHAVVCPGTVVGAMLTPGVPGVTITLTLDGVDVTAVTELRYRPVAPLSLGHHTASVSFVDVAGTQQTYTWTWVVRDIACTEPTPTPPAPGGSPGLVPPAPPPTRHP